jgi:hypothetical protein
MLRLRSEEDRETQESGETQEDSEEIQIAGSDSNRSSAVRNFRTRTAGFFIPDPGVSRIQDRTRRLTWM